MTICTNRIRAKAIWIVLLLSTIRLAFAQAGNDVTPFHDDSGHHPFEIGPIIQGGLGLTENRNDFKFFMAGVQLGKVIVSTKGHSAFRGNFEIAGQLFPFWQSYTPTFERPFCTNPPNSPAQCTSFYPVGGTYTGISITPAIIRWNLAGTKHYSFWGQAQGGHPLDQPQVPGLRRPALRLAQRRPQRRRQRLELHARGRHRRPLFYSSSPLNRFRRQCHSHLLGLSRRSQPRCQRKRTILPRIHMVEIKRSYTR